jgi:hypothetical protein
MEMQAHSQSLQPVVKVAHQAFKGFLAAQPWSYWAIDTSALEPVRPYYPVSVETLVRVLKSHYTYSDVYIFCHTSTEADIARIEWDRIPLLAVDNLTAYVITSAPRQPFLGFAGALHSALAGEIITLFPATTTDPLTIV